MTDYLRFSDGPVRRNAVPSPFPSWPPPERVLITDHAQLGLVVVDAADVTNVESMLVQGTPFRAYERRSASALTDEDLVTMTHVVRGAEYTVVE